MSGDVVIPDKYRNKPVKEIADEAFSKCRTLTKLTIPENVTEIGTKVFDRCIALEEVDIQAAITEIADETFNECNLLETVHIPQTVVKLNKRSFYNCNYIKNVYYGGTASEWAQIDFNVYVDNGSSVSLDAPYYCNPISRQDRKLYIDNAIAEDITLDCTTVSADAFYSYSELKSATFTSKVKNIGERAFKNCQNLQTADLKKSSIETVEKETFSGCFKLKEIELPSTARVIDDSAFENCVAMTKAACGENTLYIGENAFYSCEVLTDLTLGSKLNEIGRSAFNYCKALTTVTIPQSVIAIGQYAFAHTALNSATLETASGWKLTSGNSSREFTSHDDLTNKSEAAKFLSKYERDFGYTDYEWSIDTLVYTLNSDKQSYMVQNNGTVCPRNVVIPSSYNGKPVTYIGYDAFSYCELYSIEIPNSIAHIHATAFDYCSKLQYNEYGNAKYLGNSQNPYLALIKGSGSIRIHADTKAVSGDLFGTYEYQFISDITVDERNVTYSSHDGVLYNKEKTKIIGVPRLIGGDISIPLGVTTLYGCEFGNCHNITSITIPSSITTIALGRRTGSDNAFYGCGNLSSIKVSEDNPYFSSFCGVLYDKAMTKVLFAPAGLMGEITIPNSVTNVYTASGCEFGYCHSLTRINVENNNINYSSQDGVLYNKDKTEIICAPGGLIGSITIPNSVTEIRQATFYEHKGISHITIGNNVTSIGDNAFAYCTNLESVTFAVDSKLTSIGREAFHYSGLVSINLPSNLTNIEYRAFEYCGCLTDITIPNSVANIGTDAFRNCSRLMRVVFDDGSKLTCIESGTFYDCSSLTTIEIPNSVASIEGCAFCWCSKLDNISIPNSVTSIGGYAFAHCDHMTSITIPDSVTSIESGAFFGCDHLTIFCEAECGSSGWNSNWNPFNRPVVWDYKNK